MIEVLDTCPEYQSLNQDKKIVFNAIVTILQGSLFCFYAFNVFYKNDYGLYELFTMPIYLALFIESVIEILEPITI